MFILLDTLLAFIVLVFVWRCWKKTARALVRDKIFDLRDKLRNHYVDNCLDMNDGAYEKTRSRLNSLLRYTKSMRMVGFIYFASSVDTKMVNAASADLDIIIEKCDNKTAELITQIRCQACETVLLYMAATSLGCISTAIILFISFLPTKISNALKKSVRSLFEFKPATLEYAAMS